MSSGRTSWRGSDGERGQSNVIGYLLLIAIVVGGTSMLVVFGADALQQTNSASELKRAEQTMTLFDSRAAMVALGTSDVQSLNVKQQSGSFESRPDAGYLKIRHVNYEEGETETIYNETLGSVVYENGNTEIAYQGGGVWRLGQQGDARMVSPPEFHYRGSTLTLPIIQIKGRSSASGSPTVTVSARKQSQLVYPNTSVSLTTGVNTTGAPYNYSGKDRYYANPIKNGTVRVFVHSRYYAGWANYFEKRTAGKVKVFDGNNTVRLTLISLGGSLGQFPIPNEGVAQPVSGVGSGHPITEFNLKLATDQNFNGESHWSLYAVEDSKELEIHVEMDNGGGCRPARIAYYYNSPTEHQEWQTDWLSPGATDAYDCTPSGSNEQLEFNLTARDVDAEYEDVTVSGHASGKWCFNVNDQTPNSPTTLDAHSVDPGSISTGHEENLNFTTNHYLSRMGTNYDLKVQDSQGSAPPECDASTSSGGGSNMIDEDASVGVLEYAEASGAEYITFLHVTENEITADFD